MQTTERKSIVKTLLSTIIAVICNVIWVRFFGVIVILFVLSSWMSFIGPPTAGILKTNLIEVLAVTLLCIAMGIGLLILRKWAAIMFLVLTNAYGTRLIYLSYSFQSSNSSLRLAMRLNLIIGILIIIVPTLIIVGVWPSMRWKGKWRL